MVIIKHKLNNIYLDILDDSETLDICNKMLKQSKCNLLYFINAHCYNIAQANKKYRDIINNAELLLNDGIGIEVAAKLKGIPIKMNMNGTDFIPKIINLASEQGYKIYLLGGEEGVAMNARSNIEKAYENIRVVGYHNGYFNKDEEKDIIDEINTKEVDIIIVGMGVPIQEIWLYENRSKFNKVKLCIAGGAILDFIAEKFKRAPKLLINLRLEWVYRLFNEPKRLWRRYIIGNFIFFNNIIFKK